MSATLRAIAGSSSGWGLSAPRMGRPARRAIRLEIATKLTAKDATPMPAIARANSGDVCRSSGNTAPVAMAGRPTPAMFWTIDCFG